VIDVAIVGGGPAGSTAAITLARLGLSVTVIERSAYDALRIGETLPPTIRDTLSRVGLWRQFTEDGHAPSYGNCAAWGAPDLHANDYIFHAHGHGWHVDRARFDRMLATAAQDAGAVLREGSRLLSCARCAEGWQLILDSGPSPDRVVARFLVDASGRRACIARAHGATTVRHDRLIGIARLYSVECDAADLDSFTMIEAAESGWWYSAFLPGRRLITVFLTDSDLRPRHPDVHEARHTSARLRGCGSGSAQFVFSAATVSLDRAIGPGWLAAGDAAAAFDPLSSQGISSAMRSGLAAADAIAGHAAGDGDALERYAADVDRSFARYLSSRQHYYGRERRWPRAPFWNRRH